LLLARVFSRPGGYPGNTTGASAASPCASRREGFRGFPACAEGGWMFEFDPIKRVELQML